MGNSLGGRKTAKVMKINGETMKLKTPVQAGMVVKDYPGHVLLESEAVKHFGIRAKPLAGEQELVAKRLYFLVELPKFPKENGPRRVRSGINMSAKDRLESLMLSRRSVSDLSIMKPASITVEESRERSEAEAKAWTVRLRMRVPKAQVAELMMESRDETEAAEKIVGLCMANQVADKSAPSSSALHRKAGIGKAGDAGFKTREKRVGFLPINNAEMQLAVAS